jgi:hypothetical protein
MEFRKYVKVGKAKVKKHVVLACACVGVFCVFGDLRIHDFRTESGKLLICVAIEKILDRIAEVS